MTIIRWWMIFYLVWLWILCAVTRIPGICSWVKMKMSWLQPLKFIKLSLKLLIWLILERHQVCRWDLNLRVNLNWDSARNECRKPCLCAQHNVKPYCNRNYNSFMRSSSSSSAYDNVPCLASCCRFLIYLSSCVVGTDCDCSQTEHDDCYTLCVKKVHLFIFQITLSKINRF